MQRLWVVPDSGGRLMMIGADGTDEHGNRIEWRYLSCVQVRDGRWSRIEVFDLDQLDLALERTREIVRAESSGVYLR